MPLVQVKVIKGVFDSRQKQEMISQLTETMVGIEGEALVIALDLKGLAVSTGAACSSGAIEPSHVLLAMGLRPDRAKASLRFSLGKQNRAEDIDFALEVIPRTVARLRELSPLWSKIAVSH